MDEDFKTKIEEVKSLIATTRHIAMATVNENGTPHNTPLRFIPDPEFKYIYWGSHPESVHSKNIERTEQVYITLFDRVEYNGGLYMKAENAHELSGEELESALETHNNLRISEGKTPLELSYYTGDKPQRMWGAEITRLWIYGTERDEDGHILKDIRHEIKAEDLI